MKLTTFFLLAAALHLSATGLSQKVTLSGKNMPVDKVLRSISMQTGYEFVYDPAVMENLPGITLNVKDAPFTDVLDACFKGRGFTYSLTNNTIVVKTPGEKGANVDSARMLNSFGDVHGHVTDSAGNPLAGASVTIKGHTGASAVTDVKGNFSLTGVSNNATLLISNVGFETQEIRLNGKTEISVQLKVKAASLLDVVVNKGYYTSSQRLNTGDVTKVTGEDIAKQPVTDPILALEGRVPGLYIQQTSGVPGAYSTIQIRGQNSLEGGDDPLYIVDGVPFGSQSLTNSSIGGGSLGAPGPASLNQGNSGGGANPGQGMSPFNSLNPSDIESIEILKDADATAIYGSRGANGVILITTKKGKAGDTRFDLNAYTGSGKITRRIPLLNTQQYLAMRHEAFENDGRLPRPNDYDINGAWDTTRYTDWQKVLIGNPSPFTNAQASLSGGNINTQFMISGGYSKQSTVYPGDYSDQKGSLHVNVAHASFDQRFHAQFTASYINDNSNLPQYDYTGSITFAPDAPALYDAQGNLNWQIKGGTATWTNPIATTLESAKAITDNLISNLNLSYLVLPGLQIKSSFGYTHTQMNQTILTPASSLPPPNNNNASYRSNDFGTTDTKGWNIEPQINYHKKLASGQLEVLVGTTFQQNIFNSLAQYASGFASDALITDPLAASVQELIGKTYTQYRYNALFGRISYNWQEKYLLNITARRDGSSRFGPGKQFGNFGAIGAGWIFSKATFVQNNLPFLSFGKLRASYGITGNDQIGDYQYLSSYTANSSTYQGITMLSPTSLANPDFRWETNKKMEIGMELGVINDRILFMASYYRNRSNNQLLAHTVSNITGFASVEENFPALVQNKGLEFAINTTNIKTKNFTWTSSANMSLPENKLIAYPGIENSSDFYSYKVGQSLFGRYLYHYTGVNSQTGIYTFASKDGSGTPSYPQDLVFSKPITQKFSGGFDNNFNYKRWQLGIFIQFVNKSGYNYQNSFNPPGYKENQPVYVLSRWQESGDQTDIQQFTQTPASAASRAYRYLTASDATITDASFVRLKTLTFSYQVAGKWQGRTHLQNLRLYLQCQNLFTITGYKGMDPETGSSLPPLRVITAGLQIVL